MMKHYVMPIHTSNGATVCTPDGLKEGYMTLYTIS